MKGLSSYHEDCPNCGGLLWINLDWPGLPQWRFLEDGSLDEPFVCPWCESVCRVGPESKISVERINNFANRITADKVIFIKANQLSVLLCELMYSQVNCKKQDGFKIGGHFETEEELMRWCANVISPLFKSHRLVRLPVSSL